MKAQMGLSMLALLFLATISFGQGGVDPYTFITLTTTCTGTTPLPEGTVGYLYIDTDSDGPDATDPLAPLCDNPAENCPTGPALTWSYNQVQINGESMLGIPGAFYFDGYMNIYGTNLVPNRLYLRFYYPNIATWNAVGGVRWTSEIFQVGNDFASIDRELTDWTCAGPDFWCNDPDTLFMPNPTTQTFPWTPLCATFCVFSSPMVHLFIGPFLDHCLLENPTALAPLTIEVGCSGSPYPGIFAYPENGINGQWVALNNLNYIQVNLLPNWGGVVGQGTISILPDFFLGGGSLDCWLPVELGAMSVTPRDGAVDVQWLTRSESNLARFEILRDQEIIATRQAANTPTGADYQYTDHAVDNGRAYTYELVLVTGDGSRETIYTAENIVPSADKALVTEYALHTNYPNPFNPATTITFDLLESGEVSLVVFNLMGQKVADLAHGTQTAGRHTVSFDGTSLPSGVYVYQLHAGSFVAENKMLLLK